MKFHGLCTEWGEEKLFTLNVFHFWETNIKFNICMSKKIIKFIIAITLKKFSFSLPHTQTNRKKIIEFIEWPQTSIKNEAKLFSYICVQENLRKMLLRGNYRIIARYLLWWYCLFALVLCCDVIEEKNRTIFIN
jgi:hypothetical protein